MLDPIRDEEYEKKKARFLEEALVDTSILALSKTHTKDITTVSKLLKNRYASEIQKKIKTGFESLDRALDGGINRNTITQVLGPNRGGKTTFVHYFMKSYLESNPNQKAIYINPINENIVLHKRVSNI